MHGETFCSELQKCPIAGSCKAYGSCSKREQVITRSTNEWSNPDTKNRVIIYAKGMEKRLQRQYYGDHAMSGYRHESLIQESWIKLLEGNPPRSLELSLLDYFIERLNTERNRIRRRKENTSEPKGLENSNLELARVVSKDNDVSDLNAYRHQRTDYIHMRQLQDLYNAIVARDPELKDLLDLYIEFGKLPAPEQADILKLTKRRVYYMRSKLEESIIFCKSAIEDDEL